MDVTLNVQPPWLYKKQNDFLQMDRSSDGIHWSHWVGGRGSAKSSTGILLAVKSALELNPGMPGIWTAPTHKDLIDTFLREFQNIVPDELYRLAKSEMRIEFVNGSQIDLRSREKAHIGRGPNYAWAIHDEAAAGYDARLYANVTASVRRQSRNRFVATLTTPMLNGYQRLASSEGHVLMRSSSYDNPFLPDGYADELARYLDPEYARQEIYGEFISLAGRAWRHFGEKRFPDGNLVGVRFDPARHWYLGCDIGLRSSWLIVQRYRANEIGGMGDYQVSVVVGEFQPNSEDASRTVQRIRAAYGRPATIYVGADVSTRSIQTGTTAQYVFANVWGQVPVVPITGDWGEKQLQYIVASGAICNTMGERRFLVSDKLHSHDSTQRGILETMQQDAFSEIPRDGEWLPKDKRHGLGLEDTRDAFLYYCIGTYPPQMNLTNRWAA